MKINCQICKDKGYVVEERDGVDWWLAPFTLGVSLIRRKIRCKHCNN